jgi:hypothetical protein
MKKYAFVLTMMLLAAPVCFAMPSLPQEEKTSFERYASALLESGITTVARSDVQSNTYLIVKSVSPFSSGERCGIESNDRVLSVRANAGLTKLIIERAGHVYLANLAREHSAAPALDSDASSTKLDAQEQSATGRIVGQYFGHLNNDSTVTTTFFLSPEGELSGTYHADQSGGYDGTLDQCSMYSPTAIGFIWHDRFGYGSFGANFSSDFKSFRGSWCEGTVTPVPATLNYGHSWNGMQR